MNTANFGRNRKNLILSDLSFFSYLTPSFITSLRFPASWGQHKARQVLRQMWEDGEVRRFRECAHGEYVYHLGNKSQLWKSTLILNRLYFDIMQKGGKILIFQPEIDFVIGRCDAFMVAEYMEKKMKFFVEVDRATSPFEKAKIYNNLRESSWQGEFWADPLKRGVIVFPPVMVLTLRKDVVQRDFMKAKFQYHILDLFKPEWKEAFKS